MTGKSSFARILTIGSQYGIAQPNYGYNKSVDFSIRKLIPLIL